MLLLSIEERMQFGIEEIYLRYHGDMLRLAKYRLKQANVPHYRTEAEDVVQNALLKLTKYARHISPDATEKEIKNYVLTVVRKKITEAGKSLDDAQSRNDMIQKRLRSVEEIDRTNAEEILGIADMSDDFDE